MPIFTLPNLPASIVANATINGNSTESQPVALPSKSIAMRFEGEGTSNGSAHRRAPELTFIKSLKDVQLSLKPKYNMVCAWDQEFGIQATMLRYGSFCEATNFCYDPTYPIDLDKKPRFSVGFQVVYTFTTLPSKLGIYTKSKNNLVGLWKQETGLTGRLYSSRSFIVSANVACVFNYPESSHQKPQWLGLVNFQFPLGH